MQIALIGYGKMGRAIEAVALEKGHQVVLKIDLHNTGEFTAAALARADVAIEFTGPDNAASNLVQCFTAGLPVVCGSTGWLEKYDFVKEACLAANGTFLYASNFSIGVNLFFELNRKLARLMAPYPEYGISITEIHHTQKKDAPSGTAITLAEQIIETTGRKKAWVNHASTKPDELSILSLRQDPAPGIHQVSYRSDIDDLEITHTAHNRLGFAWGAVLAAEYIHNRKGIFTMKDVLDL
jgi:4-hydroxy-tetrahydrodipicolinate reductase